MGAMSSAALMVPRRPDLKHLSADVSQFSFIMQLNLESNFGANNEHDCC
jgi:hypothetical protein